MTSASWVRVAGALWASTHPGPTLVVTVLSLTLGLAAGLEPWRLLLLVVAVLAGQVSVGISNDAIDVARDRAVGRTDKPLARGDATVGVAWAAAIGALAVALVLSVLLGPGMLAAHALALASAWAYNAGLKATAFSVVPFAVSFGLLPSLATLSAREPALAPAWATAAGAVLGAAVHLLNVLPDLDDDARTGIRGLPHRLGARASGALAVAAVIAVAMVVLVGAGAAGALAWVFFAAVVGVAAVALGLALARPRSRWLFRLGMLAALLLAAHLVLTSSPLA
ncbi:UbiA family prenyltransferase [Microbacterium aureliae]